MLPALDGASVAGIVPALFGRVDDAWIPETARSADAVVLLVLDGLGWSAVQDHAPVMPRIAGMEGGAITTVAPSTTATALTSIATGLAPAARSGRLPVLMDTGVLNCLRWTVAGRGRPPDPFDVQRHAPFLGREVPVVTRTEFRDTGFTQAHLRGGRLAGWHTVAGLVEQVCAPSMRARSSCTRTTRVSTRSRTSSGCTTACSRVSLPSVDYFVGELDRRAAATRRAARHVGSRAGAPRGRVVDRDPRADPAHDGDGGRRPVSLSLREPEHAKELIGRARELCPDRAWVWSRSEVLEMGLFGEGATGTVPGRIGSVVLAAREPVAFVDPALPNERTLRSGHGSLTPDEMYVPLLAARGTA